MVRNELEHPPVQADRVLRRAEGLFFEERPLAEQIELERGVRALDAQVEEPPQVVASIRLAQDPVERLHGEVVGLVLLDELPVRLHRLVDAPHLAREHLGELRAEDAELLATPALAAVSSFFFFFFRRRPRPLEDLEPRG